MTIVIATIRPWNLRRARALKRAMTGRVKVRIIERPSELTPARLRRIQPAYVFFPHWSRMIPEEIYSGFECVVFHMTDLPFGRGGSPLQNLISKGLRRTKVSAIRAGRDLDAGPVYMKAPVSLAGPAQEIYERVSGLVFDKLIPAIIRNKPRPKPQRGRPVFFVRRKPEESRLPEFRSAREAYDFIRMLDADGYPRAYVDQGALRVEFRNASIKGGCVRAEAVFKPRGKNE
ncbi:MAG: hypothetical protein A2107_15680 [Verrucomicrobia bacterium GWF2_62_7]|nr:MAG: hypothetical protein A2107_15680 [Verrucomicrobia bacterium GWF2_62_7]